MTKEQGLKRLREILVQVCPQCGNDLTKLEVWEEIDEILEELLGRPWILSDIWE